MWQDIIGIGTCASFGGVVASGLNTTQATGLQFLHTQKGGFLGKEFCSSSGFEVINIPGCPCHPDWIVETLVAILTDRLRPH